MAHIISGIIVEKAHALTMEEFCQAIQTQPEIILQMIDYQLIKPEGESVDDWRFDSLSLKRGRIAISFYRDLEINMAGVALALELLDKIEHLQQQVNILETAE